MKGAPLLRLHCAEVNELWERLIPKLRETMATLVVNACVVRSIPRATVTGSVKEIHLALKSFHNNINNTMPNTKGNGCS
jgi:hypothetical protein